MNALTIRNAFAAAFLLLCSPLLRAAGDGDFNSVDGPNVRVMRHEDGSRAVFVRSPNNQVLTQKTYTANGVLEMVTVFRMDDNENPLSCKIFDGLKQELFKVRYGYRKTDGQLVEEQMFDSRVKRTDPASGQEMPVRRLIYTYDANGKRNAPIAITLQAGKTAKEVYKGKDYFVPESNPFKGATPNAHPVPTRH